MDKERFKPLKLKVDDPKDIFGMYGEELAIALVKAILYCIDHNKSKISFAEIKTSGSKGLLLFNVHESDFLGNLNINFDTLVKCEEYELCAEILKAKEKLAHRKPRKVNKKDENANNLISTIKNL